MASTATCRPDTYRPDTYRPDIDGLRAIAVLSVFFFHLQESLIPGGFIGVDVFFVISGFLISGHIMSSLQKGSFSFKDFYVRRMRRILPAFYGVIIFSLVVAALFLLPPAFKRMAQSAIEAISFKANYYFAGDYDYFAPLTSEVPLLHLWSLSVEEQFYLFFPILLFFTYRRTTRFQHLALLLGLLILSVGAGEYYLSDPHLQKFAFYSLSSRASELLVGAMLASLLQKISRPWLAQTLSLVGLAGLLGSFAWITGKAHFPGALALVPAVSTALIIWGNTGQRTWVGRLLSVRPLVLVGLVSYSLYLYHWPLMAFVRYFDSTNTFSYAQGAFIVVAAGLLSFLSLHFIERPLRRPQPEAFARTLRRFFIFPGVALLAVLFTITDTRGLPQRYRADSARIEDTLFFLDDQYCHNEFHEDGCVFGAPSRPPKILLLGDSHAGHYQPFFEQIGRAQGFSFRARSNDGCFPLVKTERTVIDKTMVDQNCAEQIRWSQKAVDAYDVILLAGHWDAYQVMEDFGQRTKDFEDSIRSLVALKKKVIVVEQVPECQNVMPYYRRRFSIQNLFFDNSEGEKQMIASCGILSVPANKLFKELAVKNGAIFLEVIEPFQKAVGRLPLVEGHYFYKDSNHLNQRGARIMGQWNAQHSPWIGQMLHR